MTWYPKVRDYADPFEGLNAQLGELRGLIKIVPPLIEADRRRRWEEIGAIPGDPAAEWIDIYEREVGTKESWGHTDFERTIYIAAVVTAWDVFRDYLGRQLKDSFLNHDLSGYHPLATLVEDEIRSWDRRFDQIQKRYKDFAGIKLQDLRGWHSVLHAHQLRNALTHNLGLYTSAYLATHLAYRPTDDFRGFDPSNIDDRLINQVPIPLWYEFVDQVITQLIQVAGEVRDAIQNL
jgi:hypothetical protein